MKNTAGTKDMFTQVYWSMEDEIPKPEPGILHTDLVKKNKNKGRCVLEKKFNFLTKCTDLVFGYKSVQSVS